MTADLSIADDLAFPLDALTETFLILGKRGSGKTTTAAKLAEQMITAGLPVCVIDPTGAWWGLRSSADGKGPGLPVTILGGEHADIPLPPETGERVADLVVDERAPLVLDLSAMSKTQQRKFVCAFLERIYHRNRDPLHLIIDEADLFGPMRATGEIARLIGAYEDVVRRGRIHGIGCTSITQRPASMHTDIRSQAEVLIAMRLIGKHDVAAIDDWVRLHASDEEARELKASLPSLPVGTAWVWSPGWLGILERVKVSPRSTFDSSATPKVGQQRIIPREFARVNPADLERLAARLGPAQPPAAEPAASARRDDADVRRLRAENRDLRAKLTAAEAREPERIEVSVITPGDMAALEQQVTAMRDIADRLELAMRAAQRPAAAPKPVPAPRAVPERREPPVSAPAAGDITLSKAQRAVLTVLAQFPDGRTKRQLAMLAGYSAKGGGFNNSLSSLRTAGLIGRGEPITITDAGMDALGGNWEPLPSGPALADHWLGQLSKAEAAALRVLLDAWPDALPKAEIAERAGYAADGGGFNNALSRLRTLQLIDGYGEIRADETLAREATHA
jgi:hypothetical protein